MLPATRHAALLLQYNAYIALEDMSLLTDSFPVTIRSSKSGVAADILFFSIPHHSPFVLACILILQKTLKTSKFAELKGLWIPNDVVLHQAYPARFRLTEVRKGFWPACEASGLADPTCSEMIR